MQCTHEWRVGEAADPCGCHLQPTPYNTQLCAGVEPHCSICKDNICQGCKFPFEIDAQFKCGEWVTPAP